MRAIAKTDVNARAQCQIPHLHVTRLQLPQWAQRTRCCAAGPAGRRQRQLWGLLGHDGARLQFRRTHSSTPKSPTIYALSSGAGRAAIAVIRISGSASLQIYSALCPTKPLPQPRVASVRTLYEPGKEPTQDTLLDSSALLIYFPAPRSATGEDVLELHVHGGSAVVKAVLAAIAACSSGGRSDVRYAEPGEFTRRAFLNHRLDLTQVEALGDILSAETEQQRRLSVRGTSSSLGRLYERWRSQLLEARGELEALIDFSEDQHFDESPAELCASVAAQVQTLTRMLRVHSQNAMRGELLRNGISLALLGAPNAGKSSLLNRIVGREAAIVSREAGTTRDVVEVGLDIGGYFCRLGDTAGLRMSPLSPNNGEPYAVDKSELIISQIEQEGMRRAKARAEDSDVVIAVLSFEPSRNGTAGEPCDGVNVSLKIDPEVHETAGRLIRDKGNVIVVINKADLAPQTHVREAALESTLAAFPGLGRDAVHLVSCVTAAGQDVGPAAAVQDLAPVLQATHTRSRTVDPPVDQATTPLQPPSPPAGNLEDPGGIQSFLTGLVLRFARLTSALTDESLSADTMLRQSSTHAAAERVEILGSSKLESSISTVSAGREDAAPAAHAAADSARTAPDPSLTPAAAASRSGTTAWEESLGASMRHRELLDACICHLQAFVSTVDMRRPLVTATTATQTSPSAPRGAAFSPPLPTAARHARGADKAAEKDPACVLQPYAGPPVPECQRVVADTYLEADADPDVVVAAEHLRAAADCLARITGRGDAGDVEEVLGVVFEKFCVGK